MNYCCLINMYILHYSTVLVSIGKTEKPQNLPFSLAIETKILIKPRVSAHRCFAPTCAEIPSL